ncbi:MAG: MotA/TolQ/ExbB proton channel family protein [Polyangiales bacterium]
MNADLTTQLSALTHLGAGWIMWLLIALSVASVAVMVERTIVLLRSRDDIARLRRELLPHLFARDYHRAGRVVAQSRSYEARVLTAGLEVVQDGATTAEQRMAGASTLARLAMEKRLAFLGTVGSNAPFVGLLGTVIGIVRSFAALEASGGKVSASLMSEVGEALIATAIGILVAIPAVAAFNAFQRIIKARLSNADALSRELLAQLGSNRV